MKIAQVPGSSLATQFCLLLLMILKSYQKKDKVIVGLDAISLRNTLGGGQSNQIWWYKPVIPAPGSGEGWKSENQTFKVILGYLVANSKSAWSA